ncbi:DUF362 domain-containing protein [Bacillus sp. FJAT-27245]|uniref:DUF362 domain-containing protein n=1 Tax=Bacillus sp. FJAT-27245 TaxID=1684144 RepID=UPI0006A7DEE9|nr:4Fe-4S binding protein [Bacillus sp. FJAT-27245]
MAKVISEVKVLTKIDRCKQCELCIPVCPKDAISFSDEINSSGHRYTLIDQEKCIACGICYVTCPDGVYEVLSGR